MSTARENYIEMHQHRMFLFLHGFLSEKENNNVKKKLDSYAKKNKVETLSEQNTRLMALRKKSPPEGRD